MATGEMIEGSAHKLGDHINTDLIIPATHLVSNDPGELGKHLMEGHDPDFTSRIVVGDVIVAGDNFGSGSSREHAPLAIKGGGISCVIAKSYARIFYRNALNVGLPLIESPEAADAISQGDRLRIDLGEGRIEDLTTKRTFTVAPYPEFMQRIMDAGGLIEYVKSK
jgi:3-isopropylmalate/(R)-2-methylmalate dehydratase small subunit